MSRAFARCVLWPTDGISTLRSPVFSLLGTKVPVETLLPGMKVPGNFRSGERMFPGTFVPVSECSRELSFLIQSVRFLTTVRDAGTAVNVN